MNPEKELIRRSYSFEIRAEQDENQSRIITGRPIVYNNMTDLGDFFEVIDSGALNRTDLSDVRFLVNHNTDMIPLARASRNNPDSTMHLTVDAYGMAICVNLDTENNSEARPYILPFRGAILRACPSCSGFRTMNGKTLTRTNLLGISEALRAYWKFRQ